MSCVPFGAFVLPRVAAEAREPFQTLPDSRARAQNRAVRGGCLASNRCVNGKFAGASFAAAA